jgi:antitoxin component YwqK of YwqJK toxin-antitoxin module
VEIKHTVYFIEVLMAIKMKTIAIILILVPFLSFSQTKEGFIDGNGWKQEMQKCYSGGLFIDESTYVNDTLTGPFSKYTKEGITWGAGFFKNKEYDSLWIEYYSDSTIKIIKNYNEDIKQREFILFYKSGKIQYEVVFNSDTIVGEAKNYFENGVIKAKGNRRNGEWITYHVNGKIASIENFQNGKLHGDVVMYNEEGEQILPVFIKQTSPDTNVINNSNLNVYLMFEQPKTTQRVLRFGEELFRGATVCLNETNIVLKYGNDYVIIKENGVELKTSSNLTCSNELTPTKFGINRIVKELPNGEYDIKYIEKDIVHKTSLGELVVHVKHLKCDDTGTNPITLKRPEGNLEILNIDNLQFFEYDINKDGKNELYILSYASCQGYLKIYKIEK